MELFSKLCAIIQLSKQVTKMKWRILTRQYILNFWGKFPHLQTWILVTDKRVVLKTNLNCRQPRLFLFDFVYFVYVYSFRVQNYFRTKFITPDPSNICNTTCILFLKYKVCNLLYPLFCLKSHVSKQIYDSSPPVQASIDVSFDCTSFFYILKFDFFR